MNPSITPEQYEVLIGRINPARISSRRQGGKELSYLAAYDVRAHLIRLFGFGNFDVRCLEYSHLSDREYGKDGKDMIEVAFSARVQLDVRDPQGRHLSTNIECAIGSASGPASQYAELADNALKTAVSDAMKRAALSWGDQFGLSLYDNGSRKPVVRGTKVVPEGYEPPVPVTDPEAEARLAQSLGAQQVTE